jgi:uncharacterized membrane protein YraQ (UPF0718 family)
MAVMGVIVTEMVFCLVAALAIGALFAYFYAKASARAFYEDKIDALQELCESKREEAEKIKALYSKLEIENARLDEEAVRCEELLTQCRENEEELLAQLDVIAQENASLQEKMRYSQSAQSDVSGLIEQISALKKSIEQKNGDLDENIKAEVTRDLDEAEQMLREGKKHSKITALMQMILGKIKPDK